MCFQEKGLQINIITRMHSSRMRTARRSRRRGGLDQIPLNFPLGCGPGSVPRQFPPWVWAWTWSPSTSPLGVGLETLPGSRHSPGRRPPWMRHPLPWEQALLSETCCKACWDTTCNACWNTTPPPVNRMTDACENITLPQLRCGR